MSWAWQPLLPGGAQLLASNNKTLAAEGGTYSLSGTAASALHSRKTAANGGTYSLTGTDATPKKGQVIAANGGSYALAGTAATPEHAWIVTAGGGSYSLTGGAAAPEHGWLTVAGGGSYALNGTAAAPLHGWKPTAEGGSYSLTGTAAATLHGWKVAANGGAYALTGTDATLIYTPGGTAYDIQAEGGSYSLSGAEVTLLYAGNTQPTRRGDDAGIRYTGEARRAIYEKQLEALKQEIREPKPKRKEKRGKAAELREIVGGLSDTPYDPIVPVLRGVIEEWVAGVLSYDAFQDIALQRIAEIEYAAQEQRRRARNKTIALAMLAAT